MFFVVSLLIIFRDFRQGMKAFLVLTLVGALGSVVVESTRPRGVRPELASFYNPTSGIKPSILNLYSYLLLLGAPVSNN